MAGIESKGEKHDDDGSSRFYLTLNSFEIVPACLLQKNQEHALASNCCHHVIPRKNQNKMRSTRLGIGVMIEGTCGDSISTSMRVKQQPDSTNS
jgi:hypothetical protein